MSDYASLAPQIIAIATDNLVADKRVAAHQVLPGQRSGLILWSMAAVVGSVYLAVSAVQLINSTLEAIFKYLDLRGGWRP